MGEAIPVEPQLTCGSERRPALKAPCGYCGARISVVLVGDQRNVQRDTETGAWHLAHQDCPETRRTVTVRQGGDGSVRTVTSVTPGTKPEVEFSRTGNQGRKS